MSKKILALSSSMALLFSISSVFAGGPEIIVQPDYFSGFYVGGTAALHGAVFDSQASSYFPNDSLVLAPVSNSPLIPGALTRTLSFGNETGAAIDQTSGSFDEYGGAQIGFGKVWAQRWYIGVVGFAEFGRQSSSSFNDNATQTLLEQVLIPDGPAGAVVNTYQSIYSSSISTNATIKNDYGVAFKPGFLLGPKTMVYAKIGAIWADFNVTNSYNASFDTTLSYAFPPDFPIAAVFSGNVTGSSSAQQNKVALLLGVGFEQFIFRDVLSWNVEYNYANYGTIHTDPTVLSVSGSFAQNFFPTINAADIPTTATTQASTKAQMSSLVAGINFHFGSQWF